MECNGLEKGGGFCGVDEIIGTLFEHADHAHPTAQREDHGGEIVFLIFWGDLQTLEGERDDLFGRIRLFEIGA